MLRNNKFIDLNEYMPVVIELINSGKTVPLVASGSSMTPFIVHQRDTIFISKANELHKGDMVFYKRSTGQYVMHRIHHIKNDEFYIVGDAQNEIEGPIKREQIFGVIKKLNRKGKLIDNHNFCWKFFQHVWIRIVPLRPFLIKLYTKLKPHNG